MRIIAVFNRDGGTFRALDIDAFAARAVELAAGEGAELECRLVAASDLLAELERVAADPGADALLAGGGDGTISAAAAVCFRTGKPLAVLPAGTMNMVARTLRVPLELEQAVVEIARGRFYDVDIATANGRPFMHQFSVGLHARLVRMREALQYSNRLQKMLATVRAISTAVSRRLKFEVDLLVPGGARKRMASGVSVSNNLLGEGHIPHADQVDGGVLGVYVAKPMNVFRTTWFCIRVVLGHWKSYRGVSEDQVTAVTLTFPARKRNAQATIDGELVPLESRIELRMHHRALRVLAPQALQAVLIHGPAETGEPSLAVPPAA